MKLFEHIGIVYRRLDRMADRHLPGLAKLRLAVLLHEQAPKSLPGVLAAAGFQDVAPTVMAVIGGFGELWKVRGDHQIAAYVVTHRAHLRPLLLFELAHEGRAIPEMERAASLGGLERGFKRWVDRLATDPPSSDTFDRPGASRVRGRSR